MPDYKIECNPLTNPYMRTMLATFLALTAAKTDFGIQEVDDLYRNKWFKLAVIAAIVYLNSCDIQITAVLMAVIVGVLYFKKKL